MVDYEQAFKKPFTDVVKLIIGIVLTFIPIVNWIAKGFAIESSGLGKTKKSSKMPEWKDWWHLFVRGLASDVILLIYSLPAILVMLIGIGLTIGPMMGMFMGAGITPEMLENIGMEPGTWGGAFSQAMPYMLPQILSMASVAVPAFIIGGLLWLLAIYVSPMAVMNYVKKNSFGAAFDLGAIKKKVFTGNYFITWLVVVVVTVIAMLVLTIIPVLGTAIGAFIMLVIGYSLYGQVYRETK